MTSESLIGSVQQPCLAILPHPTDWTEDTDPNPATTLHLGLPYHLRHPKARTFDAPLPGQSQQPLSRMIHGTCYSRLCRPSLDVVLPSTMDTPLPPRTHVDVARLQMSTSQTPVKCTNQLFLDKLFFTVGL